MSYHSCNYEAHLSKYERMTKSMFGESTPNSGNIFKKTFVRQNNKVGCNGKKIFALAVKQARKACRNQFVTF
jgi:hypothetical protein